MRCRFQLSCLASGIILALAATAVGQTQPAGDAYAKPVTVDLKMVTVREALKALSKASGLEIYAREALGDLKVNIFVKDEPIGSVMGRLADLFHADWSPLGTGRYELAVPPKYTAQILAYITKEDELRRKDAEAKIKRLVDGASVPYSTIVANLRSDQSNLTPDQKQELQEVASPEMYLLGSTFANLGSGDMADFWNGRVVRASAQLPPTDGNAPATPPGPPLPPQIRRRSQPFMGRTIHSMAYYDPLTGQLSMGNAGRGQLPQNANSKLIDQPYPTGELASTAFGKDVTAWNRIETDAPRLQPQVQAVMLRGDYFGGQISMADALEWLHEQSGVPIVADAFRVPVKMPRRGGSVANWLAGFQEANPSFIRTDGGFVMVRHGGFWRLRTFEAPEDAYASLEAGNPSLDQYAAFAASLTPAQTLPFRIKGASLTKVDPGPLVVGMAALRFYASLGPDVRRAALAGNPLPFSQLGAGSQTLFVEALENPVGGTPVGPGVPDPNSDAVVRLLGFLITANVPVRQGPPPSGIAPGPSTGFQMLFGTSQSQGMGYVIPLDH